MAALAGAVTGVLALTRENALIFALYAPGLVFYVLKKPKSERFGFHEYFHASVLLGHMSSMLLDLREVVICAIRVAGGPPLLL